MTVLAFFIFRLTVTRGVMSMATAVDAVVVVLAAVAGLFLLFGRSRGCVVSFVSCRPPISGMDT